MRYPDVQRTSEAFFWRKVRLLGGLKGIKADTSPEAKAEIAFLNEGFSQAGKQRLKRVRRKHGRRF